MCTILLPPGVNSVAVNKYININSTHHSGDVKQFPLLGIRRHRTKLSCLGDLESEICVPLALENDGRVLCRLAVCQTGAP
jgi:putative methionine-R-sulfoxide reductase with GAF domain